MTFNLAPIGFVKNKIGNRSEMTISGTESSIEINAEFSPALEQIGENSHLIVCCFLHQAKQNILKAHPRKFNIYSLSEKGVFATRSPDRPNPISISAVKLLEIKGTTLIVDKLDVVNDTPVLDIKPYIVESDAVFNSLRSNVKTSLTDTNEQLFYEFLKESALKYIFAQDSYLDLGIYSLIKLTKTLNKIPDRNTIEYIETDYTGNALDCVYYHFRLTPGENRIKTKTEKTQNSYLTVHLITGEIWKITNSNSRTPYPIKSLKINKNN